MLETPIENVRFVVVDVETTGGNSGDHRMTEIAMCVVEDGVVVRRYESLINPHQRIPDFIRMMTGISQEMVDSAPEEVDVLPSIVQEFESSSMPVVFVAHNVGFDWGFVSEAIRRHDMSVPDVPHVCTCRLSRRLSTGLKKHNLGVVAEHYGCTITARHRAMGDTEATAEILMRLIERARGEHDAATLEDLINLQHAPKPASKTASKVRTLMASRLAELPEEPGVYYFYNTKKTLLYVGKAKSLRSRVVTYFNDGPLHGRSVQKMIRYIRHIEWETTGTELGAMLLESREIKERKPLYNRAGTEYHPPSFLMITNEDFPRIELVHRIENDGAEYFGPFRSQRMAERIKELTVSEQLIRTCSGELNPSADVRPCFEYHVKKCLGPCALHQTKEDYRLSIDEARRFLTNVETGAVSRLATQMEDAASRLDFERAAMLRDGIREIDRVTMHGLDKPLAVSDTNIVVIVPTSDRYATVELYALHAGRLVIQRVLGTSASRTELIEELYQRYQQPVPTGAFTDRELDGLRIVTSWLYSKRERSVTVHINSLDHLAEDLNNAMNMFGKRTLQRVDELNEYSQIPNHDDYGV